MSLYKHKPGWGWSVPVYWNWSNNYVVMPVMHNNNQFLVVIRTDCWFKKKMWMSSLARWQTCHLFPIRPEFSKSWLQVGLRCSSGGTWRGPGFVILECLALGSWPSRLTNALQWQTLALVVALKETWNRIKSHDILQWCCWMKAEKRWTHYMGRKLVKVLQTGWCAAWKMQIL